MANLPVEVGAVAPKPPNDDAPPKPVAADDVVAVLKPPNAGAEVAVAPKPVIKIKFDRSFISLIHNSNNKIIYKYCVPCAANVF